MGVSLWFSMNMKELIEYMAKSIVTYPDEVVVMEEQEGDRFTYTLQVHPDDKGRVIGRGGKVAQSMRSLLRVAAVKDEVHVSLQIE